MKHRPRTYDCFPFNNELDLLECRLTELYDSVDGFVLVEATVDHQDHAKPLWFAEHRERYAQWTDKITHVVADDLPSLAVDNGPWAREHAQREWIGAGLHRLDAHVDDIVLQSDVDEIPTPVAARNVRPAGTNLVSFDQRGHFWAIDWIYPPGWRGTVAARAGAISTFRHMRDVRNFAMPIPDAGWHFSWLGGRTAALAKVGSFCHPEVRPRIETNADRYYSQGIHVDGVRLLPVEVDKSWPAWMQTEKVPESWRRPRN